MSKLLPARLWVRLSHLRRLRVGAASLLLGGVLGAAPCWAQRWPVPIPRPLPSLVVIDQSFAPALNQGATVRVMARQTDGKVLIAGNFTQVGGVARAGLARLNADGSLDSAFDAGSGPDRPVLALAVQPDGKVLVGGQFEHVNGAAARQMARLNADGSLDTDFQVSSLLAVANDSVGAIVLQPDGKIVIGGTFSYRAPTWFFPRKLGRGLMRLQSNGQRDPGFSATLDPASDDVVNALALQPDGRLLAGGRFARVNQALTRPLLARFNTDGSVDAGFTATAYAGLNSRNTGVKGITLQPDGKMVLIRDSFGTLDNGTWVGMDTMLRLLPDGSTDASFTPHTLWWGADALAPGGAGALLVGGSFGGIDAATSDHSRLALLGPTGTDISDAAKLPVPDGLVMAIAAEPGGWLVGGAFSHVDGSERLGLVRLRYQTGPIIRAMVGRCGPANGVPTPRNTLPAPESLCAAGTASSIWSDWGNGTPTWGWRCEGLYATANCGAPEIR